MINKNNIVSNVCFGWSVLFVIPILIITAASLFKSEEFELYRDIEHLLYEDDHPLLLLLLLSLVIGIIMFQIWSKQVGKKTFMNRPVSKADRYIVMAVAGGLSLFFLLLLRSKPYMDCVEVVEVARQFSRNDYSALSTPEHNSYLYIYSFQIGMVGVLELLFRLFGEGNYFSFQLLNVVGAAFMAGSIHELSKLVFDDDLIVHLTDLFICFCLPLYINVTFVYGDVIGWSLAAGALLYTLRWVKNRNGKNMVFAAVLIAAGVLLKSNDYIFLIAIVIIVVLRSIETKQWKSIVYAALCVVLTLALSAAVKYGYKTRAGISDFPEGAPASCWIAMSLIEDENFEKGWFNGYNVGTFVENNYDPAKTDQIASALVRERVVKFARHPKYALEFFMTKFVSAWNDPQFNSQIKIEWSTRHVENLSPLAVSIIEGRGRRLLFVLMNGMHFLVFFGALSGLLSALKKKGAVMTAYLILPTLGGMLFHLMWETQARYMIAYYMLLFPLSAYGLVQTATFILTILMKNKKSPI